MWGTVLFQHEYLDGLDLDRYLPICIEHCLLGSLNQGIRLASACSTEVVVVYGPEHNATQAVGDHILGLLAHNGLVVIADPLIAPVGIWAHDIGVGLHHGPFGVFLKCLTNLYRER